jgi:hypothetical protein
MDIFRQAPESECVLPQNDLLKTLGAQLQTLSELQLRRVLVAVEAGQTRVV